jgi:hypothetical protein
MSAFDPQRTWVSNFLRPKLTTRLIHGTIVQLVYAATIKKNGLLSSVSIETHSEGKVGR